MDVIWIVLSKLHIVLSGRFERDKTRTILTLRLDCWFVEQILFGDRVFILYRILNREREKEKGGEHFDAK